MPFATNVMCLVGPFPFIGSSPILQYCSSCQRCLHSCFQYSPRSLIIMCACLLVGFILHSFFGPFHNSTQLSHVFRVIFPKSCYPFSFTSNMFLISSLHQPKISSHPNSKIISMHDCSHPPLSESPAPVVRLQLHAAVDAPVDRGLRGLPGVATGELAQVEDPIVPEPLPQFLGVGVGLQVVVMAEVGAEGSMRMTRLLRVELHVRARRRSVRHVGHRPQQ